MPPRRNPTRRARLRLVSDAGALQRMAGRIETTDLDGIMLKMRLVTELARLRLAQLAADAREPDP